jgi:hypothetical protein
LNLSNTIQSIKPNNETKTYHLGPNEYNTYLA